MEIRYADSSDIEDLVYLWKKCFFEDTDDYIKNFYHENAERVKTLCGFCDGRLAGMINLIPTDIMICKKPKKAVYGYAIGVLPEYRGKGIFSELHKAVCEYVLKNGLIYILSPENEKLAEYYERCGMRRSCYIKKQDIYACPDENLLKEFQISDIDADEYSFLRNMSLKDAFVLWSRDSISYAIDEKRYCNGFAKLIRHKNEKYAIIGNVTSDSVIIDESTIDPEMIDMIIPAIAGYFGKRKITVFSRGMSESDVLNGMTVGYDGGAGDIYLNLTLG